MEQVEKKRILVVDDDLFFRRFLEFKLTRCGFQVLTARNTDEFCRIALQEKINLIILDIFFKDQLGTQMYETLLKFDLDPKLPIIFMTASAHAETTRRAPSFALYRKPFEMDVFLKDVKRLIGWHEQARRRRDLALVG